MPDTEDVQPMRFARLSPKDRGMTSAFGVRRAGAAPEGDDMAELPRSAAPPPQDEAAPLRRAPQEDDPASPLRRMKADEAAPLRRVDAEEETAPHRQIDEEDTAAPRRTSPEEPEAAPRRAPQPDEDASPLRRMEDDEAAPLRRRETEEEAAPLRRSAELPASQPMDEMRHDQTGQAIAMGMRETVGPQTSAPFGADGGQTPQAPAPSQVFAPETAHAPLPAAPPAALQRPRVQIDQIDVVVAAPATAPATPSQQGGAKAALANRYLRRG